MTRLVHDPGGGHQSHQEHPGGPPLPHPPQNVYLSFQGIGITGYRAAFDVLCGATPPTVTGGYAKWGEVSRYLQRGVTTFTGYDSAQLTVNVIFGIWAGEGWRDGRAEGQRTEDAIGRMEWMGGAGRDTGPSPVVYVYSRGSEGKDTHLIPGQYRGLPWVVSELQWGTAYRNVHGDRIWQECTVVLKHFLNISKPPAPDNTTKGSYFKVRAGRDTALLIASAPRERSPHVDHRRLARAILTNSQNNPIKGTSIRLARRSVSWKIKPGVEVWVPFHFVI